MELFIPLRIFCVLVVLLLSFGDNGHNLAFHLSVARVFLGGDFDFDILLKFCLRLGFLPVCRVTPRLAIFLVDIVEGTFDVTFLLDVTAFLQSCMSASFSFLNLT